MSFKLRAAAPSWPFLLYTTKFPILTRVGGKCSLRSQSQKLFLTNEGLLCGFPVRCRRPGGPLVSCCERIRSIFEIGLMRGVPCYPYFPSLRFSIPIINCRFFYIFELKIISSSWVDKIIFLSIIKTNRMTGQHCKYMSWKIISFIALDLVKIFIAILIKTVSHTKWHAQHGHMCNGVTPINFHRHRSALQPKCLILGRVNPGSSLHFRRCMTRHHLPSYSLCHAAVSLLCNFVQP